jgi:RNA polymerase sigma-70 factor, ECF subfamily
MDLVQRARSGDREAWRELYHLHAGAVRRVCSGFASLSRADVEDVVQETFVRTFRSIDALRDNSLFRPWALSIARSVCLKRISKQSSESRVAAAYADDPSIGPGAPMIEDDVGLREKRIAIVREMIEALPEGELRETVRLFYIDGSLSAREIAERTGVGKSAITMRLERFRARVKRRLALELVRMEERES